VNAITVGRRPRTSPRSLATAGLAGAVLLLAGCTGSPEAGVESPSPTASASASGSASASASATASSDPWDGQVTADVEVVAQELPVPWGMAPLPGERFLITMRD
jgi:glucose/arabinose dehydrogenase